MKTISARNVTREHLLKNITVMHDSNIYNGTLRHFTHSQDGVHLFITSPDNAVIIASVRVQPITQIELA